MGLSLADYVVTEAGFGSDLGFEKYVDIICRKNNICPDAVVLVVSIRAMKLHGGVNKNNLDIENVEAVELGFNNVKAHANILKQAGIPFVLALNLHENDTLKEVYKVYELAELNNLEVCSTDCYRNGSLGSTDLAERVVELTNEEKDFTYFYSLEMPILSKISCVIRNVYGATDFELSKEAEEKIKQYTENGWDKLPICICKTPLSLSDDPKIKNVPVDFKVNVTDVKAALGAGYIIVYMGNVLTLPGLPKEPNATKIRVDSSGNIKGMM